MKNIAILGSTGSIGTQTIAVAKANPELFRVAVLVANVSDAMLEEQIEALSPDLAVLVDEAAALRLKNRYNGPTRILSGREGLLAAAVYEKTDIVVTSLMGFAGLEPTIAAIEAGKDIALANKETLVVAGEIVMRLAKEHGVSILPVDSEHCALFQCLQGEEPSVVEKLILTASGGPFRGKTKKELEAVSIADCLAHPTWSMGKKITIDSATLVNKGLEVIEARWLYDVDYDHIQVVVHPQSIVHSMVQYQDGAVLAQLGSTDMKLPIQYALTYPKRVKSAFDRLDFWQMQSLTFEKPDTTTFRGLALAYEAGKIGGTMPCVLNAANEVAVAAFLAGQTGFLAIYEIIEKTMQAHTVKMDPNLDDLYEIDRWARDFAVGLLKK
jgi:1-deoxy-D-xylulose-5-phosphate reductoisomerase